MRTYLAKLHKLAIVALRQAFLRSATVKADSDVTETVEWSREHGEIEAFGNETEEWHRELTPWRKLGRSDWNRAWPRSRHRAEHGGEELKKTIRGRDEPYLFPGFHFFSFCFCSLFSKQINYKILILIRFIEGYNGIKGNMNPINNLNNLLQVLLEQI